MIELAVNEFKGLFFDRQKIENAAERWTLQVLSRFGAYARQRARTSIRKRRAVSAPGEPPSSHEGSYRRLVLFGYDRQQMSVVVGVAKFKSGGAVPILEKGGTRVDKKGRVLHYRPRPAIRLAAEEEIRRFPQTMSKVKFRG